MVRLDGDHVNWVLVVILVTLALLLAMVSSTGYEPRRAEVPGVSPVHDADHFLRGGLPGPEKPLMPGSWVFVSLRELGDRGVSDRPPTPALPGAGKIQGRAKPPAGPPEPSNGQAAFELAYTARELYHAGRPVEAREAFERLLAVRPTDRFARMWAGMAAYRAGDLAGAVQHWEAAWCDEAATSESSVWPAVALAAAHLESGRLDLAAQSIVPLERGDFGADVTDHPVVSFYAALVYERLAVDAPKYRDAVEESLAEKFSPALASSDPAQMVSPNSQSWLIFLTQRALQRTIRGARSLDRAAPVVPESATVEPSLAPTVEELLDCLGSADFASQARRKLRALELYRSPPKRTIEIFDDPELFKRGRFIA